MLMGRETPYIFKTNHDSSWVIRWCQLSHSAACKNGNIALACSFCFSHQSSVNRCGTQCKWNDLQSTELCKCHNIVGWTTNNLSAIDIEWADSNADLSNIVGFFIIYANPTVQWLDLYFRVKRVIEIGNFEHNKIFFIGNFSDITMDQNNAQKFSKTWLRSQEIPLIPIAIQKFPLSCLIFCQKDRKLRRTYSFFKKEQCIISELSSSR
jgi:hypothetical protein